MIKKTLLALLLSPLFTSGQYPDSEIYVVDMKFTKDSTWFGVPTNISSHEGYDNHPYFSRNGGSLYYVSSDNNQCDVKRYLFASKVSASITRTKESEFSPGMTPDGSSMTVVRIDADSAQRAYLFPPGNPRKPQFLPGTDSIGYYCWLNDSLLAMFIVGTPNTLQLLDRKTLQRTRIANNIGRCLRLSADSTRLLFVIKHGEKDWRIHALPFRDTVYKEVTPTLPGAEDFAVMHDGTLLMGDQGMLYACKPGKKKWKKIADFSQSVGPFTRIAISPQENKIAIVSTPKKP